MVLCKPLTLSMVSYDRNGAPYSHELEAEPLRESTGEVRCFLLRSALQPASTPTDRSAWGGPDSSQAQGHSGAGGQAMPPQPPQPPQLPQPPQPPSSTAEQHAPGGGGGEGQRLGGQQTLSLHLAGEQIGQQGGTLATTAGSPGSPIRLSSGAGGEDGGGEGCSCAGVSEAARMGGSWQEGGQLEQGRRMDWSEEGGKWSEIADSLKRSQGVVYHGHLCKPVFAQGVLESL